MQYTPFMPQTTKLTIPAGALLTLEAALADLSENRLPTGLAVKVGRLAVAVEEFRIKFSALIQPIVQEHIDGEPFMGPGHKNFEAYEAASLEHYEEEIELELVPVRLEEIEAADSRLVESGLAPIVYRPPSMTALVKWGLVTVTQDGE